MQVVAKPIAVPQKLSGALSIVLGLLAFSVFINYIDRGNLSTAAPMVKDELKLSASQLGFLLSAFFWTYPIFQIFSGWLVDRFNVCWVMATGVTGLLHSFTALLIVRFVLGVGESVAYPAYSRIMAQYIPESHRGLGNALIASGLSSGPGFSMLAGGMLMARFGWRPFFVVLGLASLLWLVPWFVWMPRGPGLASATHLEPSPGTWEILQQRAAWSSFVALFCINYLLYFMIVWPFYLVRERHFSMDAMAKTGAAVFFTQALSAVICGRYSDRWIASGATQTRVRKTFLIAGAICASLSLFASVLVGPVLCVALLMLAGASVGMSACTVWPVPKHWRGRTPRGVGRVCNAVSETTLACWLRRSPGSFLTARAISLGPSLLRRRFRWLVLCAGRISLAQ